MNKPYKTTLPPEINCSITFKEGKLIFLNEGQLVSLNSPIVLQNGIIITTDGMIRFSDGSKKKLSEGDTFFNY